MSSTREGIDFGNTSEMKDHIQSSPIVRVKQKRDIVEYNKHQLNRSKYPDYSKIKKVHECLREFDYLFDIWKKILNKEHHKQNPDKDSNQSHYQSYSQLLNKDENLDFGNHSNKDLKISPLHVLISFLNVLENTPTESKVLIREQLLKNFSGRNLEKSISFMNQVENRQNFDLSKIDKRHTSHSPNKDLLNEKFKRKTKTIIKRPIFEIIPYNLRWMDKLMVKLYAGSEGHQNISTQTDNDDAYQNKTILTSSNFDIQNSDLNPYDGEYNLNLKFDSFNSSKQAKINMNKRKLK